MFGENDVRPWRGGQGPWHFLYNSSLIHLVLSEYGSTFCRDTIRLVGSDKQGLPGWLRAALLDLEA